MALEGLTLDHPVTRRRSTATGPGGTGTQLAEADLPTASLDSRPRGADIVLDLAGQLDAPISYGQFERAYSGAGSVTPATPATIANVNRVSRSSAAEEP